MYIQIEGIDGAGKTTQVRKLKNALNRDGIKTISVKEPDHTQFGKSIKKVIMSKKARSPFTDMFAFLSAKAQLYTEIIIPNMAKEINVISDRGDGSFISYHHLATGLQVKNLTDLLVIATRNTIPQLIILLDLAPEIAIKRNMASKKKMSKFDKLGETFFNKQREVFLSLAANQSHWQVIDASQRINEVHETILKCSQMFIH